METVRVSSKFQVVIPRRIRDSLRIRPGQKIQVLLYQDRMEFIPPGSDEADARLLKGVDTHIERDRDRP
jgi:AbrB family looped-hinge helix DNA binding protein